MSVRVGLDEIRAAVGGCGPVAFLITVDGDGRPRAVSVSPEWRGDGIVVGAGRHTAANVAARPAVTLLWPGSGRPGYALLVDGTAGPAAAAEDGAAALAVAPTSAMLHSTPLADPLGDAGPTCVEVFRP